MKLQEQLSDKCENYLFIVKECYGDLKYLLHTILLSLYNATFHINLYLNKGLPIPKTSSIKERMDLDLAQGNNGRNGPEEYKKNCELSNMLIKREFPLIYELTFTFG